MKAGISRPVQGSAGQGETLDDLESAVHYNRWIAGMLIPHLGVRVLEVGCGTGNITGLVARHLMGRGQVLGVDSQEAYLRRARERARDLNNVRYEKYNVSRGLATYRRYRPDTIIFVNVLEHIRDDRKVLAESLRLLPSGGRILVFVPALQALFGSMDATYGHYRRYSLPELTGKILEAGFVSVTGRYLNLLGVLGWWWNGKVMRRKVIPTGQMMLYDRIVAVTRHFERYLPRPLGLSLFCAGRKP